MCGWIVIWFRPQGVQGVAWLVCLSSLLTQTCRFVLTYLTTLT